MGLCRCLLFDQVADLATQDLSPLSKGGELWVLAFPKEPKHVVVGHPKLERKLTLTELLFFKNLG